MLFCFADCTQVIFNDKSGMGSTCVCSTTGRVSSLALHIS